MSDTLHVIPTDYIAQANARLDLYLIVSGDEAALVDTGISTSPGAGVIDAVRAILGPRRLASLLITHAHLDHAGGATALRQAFGARIMVPRDDLGWTEDPVHQWDAFWATVGDEFDIGIHRDQILAWSGPAFTADGIVRPDDAIALGSGTIRALWTGAHTPGHTCYLHEGLGVVFTGDYVQWWGNPSADGATAFPPLYDSVSGYVAGLRAIAGLPWERMATAHRGILDRDAGLAALAQSEAFTERVSALTVELAAGGAGVTVADLAAAIASVSGAREALSVQSVLTARAHIRHAVQSGAITRATPSAWRA